MFNSVNQYNDSLELLVCILNSYSPSLKLLLWNHIVFNTNSTQPNDVWAFEGNGYNKKIVSFMG